jgi:hypothetical protein
MASRFASNVLVLISGAALVALTLGLGDGAARWIALGVGCFATVVTLAAFAVRGRGPLQRTIDAFVVLTAGWTIVAACAFGGTTMEWLAVGGGAALAGLGLSGLVGHEVLMERGVRRAEHPIDGYVERLPERPPIGIAR